MRSRHKVSAAAAVTALALLLSSCSSSGSKAGKSAGSSDSSGGGGASGSPIAIGTIASLSGGISFTANAVKAGLDTWVKWVNDNGGINGHPVKLYSEDDAGQATQALTAAKKLVQQDHIVALVGEAGAEGAYSAYFAQQGVPIVGGQPETTGFFTNPNDYAIGTNQLAVVYGADQLASTVGPKMGFLYCAEVPACKSAEGLQKAFASSLKISIPVSLAVSATAPDYTAQCQALKDAGVNSYFSGLTADVALKVGAACSQLGLKAVLVGAAGGLGKKWLETPAVDGALFASEVISPDVDNTPATKTFHDALAKYAPNVGDYYGPNVQYGWVSGQLFAAAIKGAGTGAVTSASVKAGLYALKGETLGGMTAPITFTQGKVSLNNCYFTVGIKDGKFTDPNNGKVACAPDALIGGIVASIK